MGTWHSYRSGRRYIGRLGRGDDLIRAVTALGVQEGLATAAVTITGRLTRWTIGTFDPRQQVYITRCEDRPMEIVICRGLLSTGGERPFFHAHIQVADEKSVFGGRLFPETLAAEAECLVEELRGPLTDRCFDAASGQLALTFQPIAGHAADPQAGA